MDVSEYEVIMLQPEFFEDLKKHKREGRGNLLKKIDAFFKEVAQHPTTGTGKPEQLKWMAKNRQFWSRRVDKRHRFVYEIKEEEKKVIALSCYGHYENPPIF